MKVLLVGMARSIHTARWVNQLVDRGLDVHLFPSFDNGATHPILTGATVHHSVYCSSDNSRATRLRGIPLPSRAIARTVRNLRKKYDPSYRVRHLAKVISKIQPDVVHSLGVDTGGLLVLNAKKSYKGVFPPWAVSNWGSDLFFFGRLAEYRPKMLSVLAKCDHFLCECERDEVLAKNEYGFRGTVHPYIQCGGGWGLKKLEPLRNKVKTSQRKMILVKGYQHLTGRALTALRALERCQDVLDGYEIVIMGADPEKDMRIWAEHLAATSSLKIRVVGQTNDYESILQLQSQARMFIGLSISDGVSNSFLEAMIMGAFPIQSVSSSPHEWISDGVSGFSVQAQDTEAVEKAIRLALENDQLVDTAATINWNTALDRLDIETAKDRAIAIYENIAQSGRKVS